MSRSVRNFVFVATTALALCAIHIQPLQAIGPSVLMFYGEPLKKPVFVTGKDAAPFADVLRPNNIAATEMSGRAFLNVALFWGSPADPAANGTPLEKLTPQMAWQHGRFYAATARQPALFVTTMFTKQVQGVPDDRTVFNSGGPLEPAALAVLQRLGIAVGPPR